MHFQSSHKICIIASSFRSRHNLVRNGVGTTVHFHRYHAFACTGRRRSHLYVQCLLARLAGIIGGYFRLPIGRHYRADNITRLNVYSHFQSGATGTDIPHFTVGKFGFGNFTYQILDYWNSIWGAVRKSYRNRITISCRRHAGNRAGAGCRTRSLYPKVLPCGTSVQAHAPVFIFNLKLRSIRSIVTVFCFCTFTRIHTGNNPISAFFVNRNGRVIGSHNSLSQSQRFPVTQCQGIVRPIE